MADALESGYVWGNGCWHDGRLVGLNTWLDDQDPFGGSTVGKVWRSSLLAVATDYPNRDVGLALKTNLVTEARAAGVEAVTSMVRWDNIPMLSLNRKLDGSEVRIPSNEGPDEIHCWSIVPVRPAWTASP